MTIVFYRGVPISGANNAGFTAKVRGQYITKPTLHEIEQAIEDLINSKPDPTDPSKLFFLLIDIWVQEGNPSYGFSNTKQVLVFNEQEDLLKVKRNREDWDLSCKAISYKDALRFAEPNYYGLHLTTIDGKAFILELNEYGQHSEFSVGDIVPFDRLYMYR